MMHKQTSPVEPMDSLEERLADFLRAHVRRPAAAPREQRFSARLALQRAFVAAPTD